MLRRQSCILYGNKTLCCKYTIKYYYITQPIHVPYEGYLRLQRTVCEYSEYNVSVCGCVEDNLYVLYAEIWGTAVHAGLTG